MGSHCTPPPYNKQVDRTKLARHAACLRKRHAGPGPSLLLRRRAFGRALRLIERYGRKKGLRYQKQLDTVYSNIFK
jgi:hypothetical protein